MRHKVSYVKLLSNKIIINKVGLWFCKYSHTQQFRKFCVCQYLQNESGIQYRSTSMFNVKGK